MRPFEGSLVVSEREITVRRRAAALGTSPAAAAVGAALEVMEEAGALVVAAAVEEVRHNLSLEHRTSRGTLYNWDQQVYN